MKDIKLESLLNFRIGYKVRFNPDNHGFERDTYFDKVKTRPGTVRSINEIERTVTVRWRGQRNSRKYNYQRLLIL